jgi:uncharacterized protein YecE (DUF72 family)
MKSQLALAFDKGGDKRFLIGTSGYAYPAWKGRFYPKKLRAKDMLRFYSEKFCTVEINNTFYKMPTEELVTSWADQVGSDFIFAIKAPQTITHHQRLKGSQETLTELLTLVTALSRKQGPLLFQLPPNFKLELSRLAEFLSLLPKRKRVAFEFRHDSWFNDDVFRLLQKHRVALCVAEDEKLATPLIATTDWGYLRLRREDYRERDIADWAAKLRRQSWERAYVYFKHEDSAKGPRLGALLQGMLNS